MCLAMRKLSSFVFALVGLSCFLCPRAQAQQTLGSINGTVTDSTGAVVQSADVKVHNVATGLGTIPAVAPSTTAFGDKTAPFGSGIIQGTLGSPRLIQMALHLTF